MGHAIHFLERLDRVNDRQTELALALYRDDDLLKSVLSSVDLAPDVERLAVSLDDPEFGPFVVLTRTGRFVTCLAHGMLATGLPVITRERFEIAAQRVQRMRDEIERLRQLRESGADSEVTRLMRGMEAGPRFCREDAEVLARVQPLISGWLAPQVVETLTVTIDLVRSLGAARFDKLKPREADGVLLSGRLAWSIAHKVPFLGLAENRQLIARKLGEHRGVGEVMPAAITFEFGTFTHCHRALWVAARAGSDGLSVIRHLDKRGPRFPQRVFRELSLGAVACASTKRRAEASKALFDFVPDDVEIDESWDRDEIVDAVVGSLGALVNYTALGDPEGALEYQRALGVGLVQDLLRKLGVPAERVEAVPEGIARTAVATLPISWYAHENARYLKTLVRSLPWLSQAPIEELFLPREWASVLIPELSIDETVSWLKPFLRQLGMGRTPPKVREGDKVHRNDPCPCGSGKKAKRCGCAGRTVAAAPS